MSQCNDLVIMLIISVVTDKGTGKRVRISDIEITSRARKGVLIIREVKTNPHKLLKTFVTDNKRVFGLKDGNNIDFVKASEFTIMDRYSTGTSIHKGKLHDAFELATPTKEEQEVKEEIQATKKDVESNEYRQLSLLEIDDEMNKIDDMLDNIDEDL